MGKGGLKRFIGFQRGSDDTVLNKPLQFLDEID